MTSDGKDYELELGELAEQQQPFLPLDDSSHQSLHHDRQKSTTPSSTIRLTTVVCFCSAFAFLVAGLWYQPSDMQCVRKLNAWCS